MVTTMSSSAMRSSTSRSLAALVICGASLVGELRADLGQLVLDDLQHQAHVGEDLLVPGDLLAQLGELVFDLVALESGQAAQAHLEDRVGLDRREAKALDELGLGLLVVVAARG